MDDHHKPFILRLDTRYTSPCFDNVPVDATALDFKRCDIDVLRSKLSSIGWIHQLSCSSVDETVSAFYNILHGIFDECVPHRRLAPAIVNRKPWWTAALRHMRNKLRKTRNQFFGDRTDANRIALHQLETDYNDLLSSTYAEYVNNIQSNLKQNPSSFWSFVRAQKSSKRTPCNVEYKGQTASSAKEAANLFANFFQSVFRDSSPAARFHHLPSYDVNLPAFRFSAGEVLELLHCLDASKGPGVDGLPPSFIKSCAHELVTPVALIFNRSLTEGTFPAMWKTARMIAIHKGGSINQVENYRGISILCCLGKVFETGVRRYLYNAAKPFISEFQHGFVENRSTTTNLMEYVNTLFPAVESRCQVDSVYVDFSKAFDLVPHNLLIEKLRHLGFPNWITNWLNSYLTDRKAFVQVNQQVSNHFSIPSGVPQGSVLGPLIFVLFINDLADRVSSGKLFFADDLKMFRIIASALDCTALQNDIDQLLDWCQENGMFVNLKKCKVITFTRCHTPICFSYKIGSASLDRVESIRDLGVIMDSRLNFNEHISLAVSKAFSVLGFVRRHSTFITDIYALKALYCSLVRSILEYAAPVWAPHQVTQILKIERVQKYFIRFALRQLPWENSSELPPYNSRCLLIDLETLSARRTKLQRVFIFDLLTNRIDCSALLNSLNINVPSRILRSHNALVLPVSRTNYGFNNPFYVCIRAFNTIFHLFDFDISKNVFVSRIKNIA